MIKNYNLELFLSNYFGKNIKEVTKEELEQLESISLDGLNIDSFYEKIDIKEVLNLFPKLNSIVINNYVFTDEDIKLINTLNIIEYSFYKCDFKSIKEKELFKHAQILMFENCAFKNYEFLQNNFDNLEVLCISNPKDEEKIDINLLNAPKLNELYLEKCLVNNLNLMEKYNNLEFINILGTDITKEEILKLTNMEKLSILVVGEEYIDNEIIEKFNNKNIEIKNNLEDMLYDNE
ncbi:MAG: hypothetical protein PUA90_02295 [bacterium]|nr:hypothetical protein [bacterium]